MHWGSLGGEWASQMVELAERRRRRRFALAAAVLAGLVTAASVHASGRRDAREGFVTLPDGVRIHYLEGGVRSGPTLVFVPGWMMTAEIWEPQLARFSQTHHVVAIDPRGQGRSSKPPDGLYP